VRGVALALIVVASCHRGRDEARTALDAYNRLTTQMCRCRDHTCAAATEHAWLETGVAATRGGARYSDGDQRWLVHLGLHLDQCRRRADGEAVEMVEY